MKSRNVLAFTSLLALAALVACGGGSTTAVPGPGPTNNSNSSGGGANATANVSFYVIVPTGSQPVSKRRRPLFSAPGGTQSVGITLTSVNGSPANGGSPTVIAIGGTNSSCTAGNSEYLCSITLSSPVGTLLYTVDTYTSADGSGTPSGEGVIQVTTTAGQTTIANAALGGTVASLVVVLNGAAELGAPTTIQVFLEALNANGYTILGNYTSPVQATVTDVDASGATSLSNAAQTYSNSNSTSSATLNYSGAAMSAPATIGAMAQGITNVTPASFLPDATAPTVNGASTTFAYSWSGTESFNGSPGPSPTPTSGVYTVTVATGQSFNGVNNLIAISGLQAPTLGSPDAYSFASPAPYFNGEDLFDSNAVTYFAWTPQGNVTSLGYVGVNDPSNYSAMNTCATPYSNQLEVPFPSSWNVLSGAGSCMYTSSQYAASSFTATVNSDGSYSSIFNPCGGCFYLNNAAQPNGSAIVDCFFGSGGDAIAISAPSPGAATVSVTEASYGGPNPAPPATPTPSPETTTGPNPWLAFANDGATALSSGVPPNPLESDTFAAAGSGSVTLPAQCAVPAGILGSNPTLSEMVETIVVADPLGFANPIQYLNDNYQSTTVDHYYLAGVGEICNEQAGSAWEMEDGALGWYLGGDYNIDSYGYTEWTYVTTSSLTATYARVRSFAQALPATARAFSAATYTLIHVRPQVRRRSMTMSPRMQAAFAKLRKLR